MATNFTTWTYDPIATGLRIAELLEKRGAKTALWKGMGRAKSAPSQWTNGEGLTIEVLGVIAEFTNRSVDYLIGRTQQEDTPMDEKQRKIYALIVDIKTVLPQLDETAIDIIRTQVALWKHQAEVKEGEKL